MIYKEILQFAFVEDLLDMMRYEFVTKIHPALPRSGDVYLTLPQFDQNFQTVMAVWEAR